MSSFQTTNCKFYSVLKGTNCVHISLLDLFNAKIKRQLHSDNKIPYHRLKSVVYIPLSFFTYFEGSLFLLVVKLIDENLSTGPDKINAEFTHELVKIYKLGTIGHAPGSFKFNRVKIT